MKRSNLATLILAAGLLFSHEHASAAVIACDIGSTGSTQYPNVSCTSNGYLNVNATVNPGATTGAAANGAAVSGNPVLVAGYDGTLVRTILTDTSGRPIVNINGTVATSLASLPALATGANTIGAVNIAAAQTLATVTTVGTVSAVTAITNALPAGGNLIGGVTDNATTNAVVDHSGTITTGGTSQTLSAAKSRHYFFVQNTSTTNLYINFTSAASAGTGSILLLPNSSFVMEAGFVSNELITIFGATTGQTFTSKDF